MVISAWGTGYKARYQGTGARFVQQAYFWLDLLNCFYHVCVRKDFQCHYLTRSWLGVSFHHCALFVAELIL